jgi:bacterioferritin (cytochrome b1)
MESGSQIDWDYLIERLEFYEAEAARDLSRAQKLIDRILMFVGDAEPTVARRAREMVRRQENAVVRLFEALRDARWQAMALRAHSAPDARTGPIFDNPTELRRYLAAV